MSNPQGIAPLMKTPYIYAMQGKWNKMANYFEENQNLNSPIIGYPITIAGDTAFHLAVRSKKAKPLQDLLLLLDQQEVLFENMGQSSSSIPPIMSTNSYGNTVLHEAAIHGNIEAAKLLKEDKYALLLSTKNVLGETPLFTAATYGKTKLVEELISSPGIVDHEFRLAPDHRQRNDSTTIIQATVHGSHFETAFLLLKWDESLADLEDKKGFTALHVLSKMPSAFTSGYHMGKLKRLIYDCFPAEEDEHADEVGMHIPSQIRELKDLESGTLEDLEIRDRKGTCLYILRTVAKVVCRFFCKGWPVMENFWNNKKRHKLALKLAELMIKKHVSVVSRLGIVVDSPSDFNESSVYREKKNGENKDEDLSSDHNHQASHEDVHGVQVEKSSPVLLIATGHGIVEIVEEFLAQHPQAVEDLNHSGQNILHIAIMHRQKKIYDLIKHKMSLSSWDRFNRRIDNNGYTVLHQVADTKHYTGGTKPGPALRLQEELRWFKRIEKGIPSHYVLHCENTENLTAEMMFEKRHKNDLENAQKWIKDTSQSCSTVAVLVATVVFAAAYTVPGGSNQKGIPNFLHSPYFKVFTVFDVVSLASSLTSLVMFLSVLTSPLELYDFHRSLPRKVMFGFTLLFFSVLTTMVAFGSTIAILVQSVEKRTAVLISAAACVPVAVFALMLLDLYLSYLSTIKESLKPMKKALPWFLLPSSLRRQKRID